MRTPDGRRRRRASTHLLQGQLTDGRRAQPPLPPPLHTLKLGSRAGRGRKMAEQRAPALSNLKWLTSQAEPTRQSERLRRCRPQTRSERGAGSSTTTTPPPRHPPTPTPRTVSKGRRWRSGSSRHANQDRKCKRANNAKSAERLTGAKVIRGGATWGSQGVKITLHSCSTPINSFARRVSVVPRIRGKRGGVVGPGDEVVRQPCSDLNASSETTAEIRLPSARPEETITFNEQNRRLYKVFR